MATLGYGTVGSNRLEEAKAFYDALFASIGVLPVYEHPTGGRLYGIGNSLMFGVLAPFDGGPASVGNGSMHAFAFRTRSEVDAFYNQALHLGGKDEGPPGDRGEGFYFCYFRDLDGNKLCAYNLG